MKVTISTPELVGLLGKVQSIVPSKPSIPIYTNILLEATKDGVLTLSASDGLLSIRASLKATVTEDGAIALPGKKLFSLVREISSPFLEIRASSPETAIIESGTSRFRIQGAPKSSFPVLPDLPLKSSLSLSASLLKDLLSKTSFCASEEESNRPSLCSVFLQTTGQVAFFIGTDGKRIAKARADISFPPDFTDSFIIPIKTVHEMIKLLDCKEEQVSLRLTEEKLSLQAGAVTLISQLLLGQYPDVSRVIPTERESALQLHREELTSLLRQVSLFTEEDGASVKLSFSPGVLQLSALSQAVGDGAVSMPVDYRGEPLEVAFNPLHFLDILRHSKDETISLSVGGSFDPGLITDSSKTLYVLMPMKIGSNVA